MEKNVYLYVSQGLADWEYSLAVSMISGFNKELIKTRDYNVITFGFTEEPVKTLAGITVIPDTNIDEIDLSDVAMIILPGSPSYEKEDPSWLVPLIRRCIEDNIPVAAICDASLFLAKHGFLDDVRHTGCGPLWLKEHAPEYHGGEYYVDLPSVSDKGIITANPFGFVEFAYNIIAALDAFPPEFLEFWLIAVKEGYLNADSFKKSGFKRGSH